MNTSWWCRQLENVTLVQARVAAEQIETSEESVGWRGD